MTTANPRPITLQEIKDKLKGDAKVTVYFKKINGEPRRMICTWNEKYVPYNNEIAQVKKVSEEETKEKTSLSVWDTEKNDWRSFRLDSIYRINAEQVKYAGS